MTEPFDADEAMPRRGRPGRRPPVPPAGRGRRAGRRTDLRARRPAAPDRLAGLAAHRAAARRRDAVRPRRRGRAAARRARRGRPLRRGQGRRLGARHDRAVGRRDRRALPAPRRPGLAAGVRPGRPPAAPGHRPPAVPDGPGVAARRAGRGLRPRAVRARVRLAGALAQRAGRGAHPAGRRPVGRDAGPAGPLRPVRGRGRHAARVGGAARPRAVDGRRPPDLAARTGQHDRPAARARRARGGLGRRRQPRPGAARRGPARLGARRRCADDRRRSTERVRRHPDGRSPGRRWSRCWSGSRVFAALAGRDRRCALPPTLLLSRSACRCCWWRPCRRRAARRGAHRSPWSAIVGRLGGRDHEPVGERIELWRLLGLAAPLYLAHSLAALAAVLPYDAVVAPEVLARWVRARRWSSWSRRPPSACCWSRSPAWAATSTLLAAAVAGLVVAVRGSPRLLGVAGRPPS